MSSMAGYAFVVFFFVITLPGAVLIVMKTYPSKRSVNKIFEKSNLLKNDSIYFYLRKCVAYRSLFSIHITYYYIFKILGILATIITVYSAFQSNEYIVFFALIAAISDILGLTIPFDKLASCYVCCARIMEDSINSCNGKEQADIDIILAGTYSECESMISTKFM